MPKIHGSSEALSSILANQSGSFKWEARKTLHWYCNYCIIHYVSVKGFLCLKKDARGQIGISFVGSNENPCSSGQSLIAVFFSLACWVLPCVACTGVAQLLGETLVKYFG